MTGFTLKQFAALFHFSLDSSKKIAGASIDTRTLKPGELFFALKGERIDSHNLLADAAVKGALGAVVAKSYQGPHYGMTLIPVEDPLHALQEWAKQVIAHRRVRIVAVTGSIGKTTTKEFIKTILSTKYVTGASPGNSNSQVGIPLAILNHTQGNEEILVLEMGMTHSGNLTRLVQIAPPEVALITNVALVHACNFQSLEEIGWAKAEIFSHSSTRLGIIPYEIVNYPQILRIGNCHKLSFSLTNSNADYYLDFQSLFLKVKVEGKQLNWQSLKIPGKHNMYNVLSAAIIARHFNIHWDHIIEALPFLELPERRLQFINHKDIIFLNDSYNASELSVKAALETLPTPKVPGSKIGVLGSMMELGKFSNECHQRVGEFALDHLDQVYCLGEECQPIYEIFKKAGKPTHLFLNRAELVAFLRTLLKPLDVVLLKGSRSKELWKVLEEL